MPAQQFSIHVNPDDLARQDLAAAVPLPSLNGGGSGPETTGESATTAKHGARDERLAARRSSERERSGKAAGTAGGRSYAFRRS
jgi:hypothetical protein